MNKAGSPHASYRVRPRLHAAALDGEVLVWDRASEELHRLNPTLARVWDAAQAWQTERAIVRRLAALLPATPYEEVATTVAAALAELDAAGLLERRIESSEPARG